MRDSWEFRCVFLVKDQRNMFGGSLRELMGIKRFGIFRT